MGILRIALRNFAHRVRTRSPGDRAPLPEGFRGMVEHDAAACTGCEACAYVCSPGAIRFEGGDERSIDWKFFAGQCTFCGRCAQYCPTEAIRLGRKEPIVTDDPSQHRVEHKVTYKTCVRCGRPIRPLPEKTLRKLYRGELPEAALEEQQLCEECRRKAAVGRIRDAFIGKDGEPSEEKR